MSENLHTIIHHVDFFPLRIRVFRNGDMFDQGRILVVTRKQFKHWIVFLDALTALLRTATAVKRIFTIQGIPIHHFDELETNGEYVAVENGPFVGVPYGQTRFTLRGKRYNPIIRTPAMIPTFLNSAESMDIYLKKEGYGTITGLPYPFDGILSRSPSASNIQIQHLSSHIPPLKIGGSMEHLNEIGTASWLGKNEKWMMGERVKVETQTTKEEGIPKLEIKDMGDGGSTTSEVVTKKGVTASSSNTKLPRLLNSNRSFKRSNQNLTSENPRQISETLPPIDLKSSQMVTQKDNSDTISIKTEEEVISILKPEKTTTESTTITSKVSRKNAPKEDDEVRFHRSYQVTQTTFTTRNSDENLLNNLDNASEAPNAAAATNQTLKSGASVKSQMNSGTIAEKTRTIPIQTTQKTSSENTEIASEKPPGYGKIANQRSENLKTSQKSQLPEKKERAKWSEKSEAPNLKREKSRESLKMKREKSVEGFEKKEKTPFKGNLKKFDVDVNEIPIRYEGGATSGGGAASGVGGNLGRSASRIVTSRSTMHLFVDEVGEDELDDVIERAQLWDMNRRRQKMRQQCTQTSASMCRSISAPRRRVVLFDPDFD